MTRKLFGTDGVRGTANRYPMTPEVALSLGRGMAHLFRKKGSAHPRVVIGKDTRRSGYMIENAISSGVCSAGADAIFLGPLPTPGIAFITTAMRADAGVVISASHNPFSDNGIKFFDHTGFKLPDELEKKLEELIASDDLSRDPPTGDEIGRAYRVEDAPGRYIEFLKSTFPRDLSLDGLKIVIDCAHGAAYRVAPTVLEELGALVIALGVHPNGLNINENSGALHPQTMCERVRKEGAHIGIALDGDADRAILCDEKGEVLDGDVILAMAAREMKQREALKKNTVVATVMSNFGLEQFTRKEGLRLLRTPVGDRYVVEAMREGGYNLGGEQSGHLIFLDHATTGDGILAGLQVLSIMLRAGKPLSELKTLMSSLPQFLENVKVARREDLNSISNLKKKVLNAEKRLQGQGRLLLRYSGTEPLVRIMVEGENEETLLREIVADLKEEVVRSLRSPLMPRLGVNIDHVATLRQARKTPYPDPVLAAREAEAAGADQITIHLREDRRHIQDQDLVNIRKLLKIKLNLEMAATEEMVGITLKARPDMVTLVPEKRQELTTEGGLSLQENFIHLKGVVERLQSSGIPVSLFINPDLEDVKRSQDLGALGIELHTGQYAEASTPSMFREELERIKAVARFGAELKLKVFAGHGLHYENVLPLVAIPEIEEYNIGHSIIARAVFVGLGEAVREMKRLLK